MLTLIVANLAGAFFFLYLFWKKLKEDYFPTPIFSTAFYMILGISAGLVASKVFFPSTWFWFSFLGACLGLVAGIARFRLRVYETIEAATISLLPWTALIFFEDAVTTSLSTSFFAGVASSLLIVVYVFLNNRYKRFTWYASGRVGFTGLMTLGIFFLVRSAVAIFVPNVLSFVGGEVLISGILAFVFFLSVFSLARQKV